MTESSEKQEYIHWLEISESLGVDVSREIEFYFDGVADLGGGSPLPDDIKTEVSSSAQQLALTASESSISEPDTFRTEPLKSSAISNESTRKSTVKNPTSTKAAQQTVSKDKNDEKRSEHFDDSSNVLGLDWSAQVPPSGESKAPIDESEVKEIPKREKRPEEKQVAAERKPVPPKPASEKQDVDLLGWGANVKESGASKTSEAEPLRPPVAEKKKESRPERHIEKPKPKTVEPRTPEPIQVSLPETDDVFADGFGAGLIEPPIASRTPPRETPRPPAAREVPRKPVREAKVEKEDHIDPLGFFDSASNQPKQSDLSADDSDIDSLDDDLIEEIEEPVLESAWDEDFVEFEIEDLDPNAGRQPRNRNRDSRDARPARVEKPVRRDPPPLDDEIVELDVELDVERESPSSNETRSDEPVREGATRSGTRSSRRRKSRGRRKPGESPTGDHPNASKPPEPATRSKKPDSRPRPQPVNDLDDDFDDDDDDFEGTSSSDETRSSKPRNLPTWNETVDVIVQSNIASRKKQPPRRRRGGSGGGPNRQR